MKSIISALAFLTIAGVLLNQAGCSEVEQAPAAENPALAAPVPAGMTRGKVLETMESGGYTYVSIETSPGPVWAAGPQTTVKIGDVVQFSEGMPMHQFQSKTLNRTFDVLYFVKSLENLTTATHAPAQADNHPPAAAEDADISVAELKSGQNIAWVYANKDSLAEQPISLRGRVVKYNSNILGWNFLHIQDGSGAAAEGNNDLTVTSEATTAVGETVVVTGTLILDKDFGSGYRFPVLLEGATITAE